MGYVLVVLRGILLLMCHVGRHFEGVMIYVIHKTHLQHLQVRWFASCNSSAREEVHCCEELAAVVAPDRSLSK